jgi:head-tail adaptor
MRAGKLDTPIVLQRRSTTLSNTGEQILTWNSIATRWCDYKPLLGIERHSEAQWVAKEQVQFTIRWSQDIDDLSAIDRVILPASDAANSPILPRSIFDIMTVHQPDRFISMVIHAARRT